MAFAKALRMCALLLLWAISLDLPPALAQGQGDLSVTPTRVSFEGRQRSAQISLINRAPQSATYRISFTQMRMDEDGRFEEISEAGPQERFADHLIRYSPRQVTLAPGEAQTVRLMLRKPPELLPGEYRSHLLLYAVPTEAGHGIESAAGSADGGAFGVRLTPIYRIAVPVLVRHGELSARAELTDLAFEPVLGGESAPPELSLRVLRHGDRSLYGDLAVSFFSDLGGGAIEVGRLEGLAVYTPNLARTVRITLRPPDGVVLEKGRLAVVFEEARESGGATAEAELPLS